MMPVLHDVTCNAHAQTRTLSHGLGREEVFVEVLFHLVADTHTIVLDSYLQQAFRIQCRLDVNGGHIFFTFLLGTVPNRIAGIVHQVQHGTTNILWNHHHLWQSVLIALVNRDVKAFMIGS